MKVIIKGRPHSKKNSRRNFGHVSLPSLAYERFKHDALGQLKAYRLPTYTEPVRMAVLFRQKGRMRSDLDNGLSSIMDVLQDAGVLTDDTLVTEVYAKKEGGYKEFETEVEIELL